jgi:hypothetical protein
MLFIVWTVVSKVNQFGEQVTSRATNLPERGCVEDQPQQYPNWNNASDFAHRPAYNIAATGFQRSRAPITVSTLHAHPETAHCSKAMFSDREPNRPLPDCSQCIYAFPIHDRCRA